VSIQEIEKPFCARGLYRDLGFRIAGSCGTQSRGDLFRQGEQNPEFQFHELGGVSIDEFWRASGAPCVGLGKDELAGGLLAGGLNTTTAWYPGFSRASADCRFLALAAIPGFGCATRLCLWPECRLGSVYDPLPRADEPGRHRHHRVRCDGTQLADSLQSEMFGLTERDGGRRLPLAYYSGRGSARIEAEERESSWTGQIVHSLR
jgi:hypothetical protein